MTLSDVLSARANAARATASVDCGALGALTLEALPLRELERYGRSADADRAIFYAACRDLQRTGAELLKTGKVYRPDQVTALVSDAEAAKAADAVRRLSGFAGGQDARESADMRLRAQGTPAAAAQPGVEPKGMLSFPEKKASLWTPERKGSGADLRDGAVDDRGAGVRDDTFSKGDRWRYSEGERSASKENEAATPSAGDDAVVDESGVKEDGQVSQESDLPEVRLEAVQESSEVRQETVQDTEDDGQIRLDTVRQNVTQFNEFRHGFVQNAEVTERVEAGDGQVSREFLTEELTEIAKPDKAQVLWSETAQTPQNVVEMDNLDGGLRNIEPPAEEKPAGQKKKKSNRAHESKSEFDAEKGGALHENESDSAEEVHEDTSELAVGEVQMLHEIESEFAETMHEDESDFRRGEVREMHESTSEFVETLHESKSEHTEELHETESERAERVARLLLEGLRRAAWVR